MLFKLGHRLLMALCFIGTLVLLPYSVEAAKIFSKINVRIWHSESFLYIEGQKCRF